MLKNMCPHDLDILAEDGTVLTIKPTGVVPRCRQTEEVIGIVNGIKITRQTFGDVVDLPEPQEGVQLIVSRVVAMALPQRTDLLMPGPIIRGADGVAIGCKGLSIL